jgi:hypothetical protein
MPRSTNAPFDTIYARVFGQRHCGCAQIWRDASGNSTAPVADATTRENSRPPSGQGGIDPEIGGRKRPHREWWRCIGKLTLPVQCKRQQAPRMHSCLPAPSGRLRAKCAAKAVPDVDRCPYTGLRDKVSYVKHALLRLPSIGIVVS